MDERQGVTVRQATIFDLDLLVPLFDAHRQFHRKPSDPDLARQFLFDRLRRNQSILLVALQSDSTAAGFTQLFPRFSSAAAARIFILNDLFVRPEFRRAEFHWNRVAALLLKAAARFGAAAGAVRLTLSTEITNKPAQALYEARGWKPQTDFTVYNLALEQKNR